VADDTGTDWAALADKLLLWSDAANVFEDTDDDRDELRAAAVGLRRLAQLDTAIGDPGNLRLLADTFDLPILRRIADAAVLGSGEQPEGPTCPTCGSDARRWALGSTRWGSTLMEPHHCPDSWHGEQR